VARSRRSGSSRYATSFTAYEELAKEKKETAIGDHQRENSCPIGTELYLPDGLGKRGITDG
jgi:hypothetical protein